MVINSSPRCIALFLAALLLPWLASGAEEDASNLGMKPKVTPAGGATRGIHSSTPAAKRGPVVASRVVTRSYKTARGVIVEGREDGTQVELPYVKIPLLFVINKAELADTEALDNLRRVAEQLRKPECAGGKFVVEGHTCDLGTREFNMQLARERAETVLRALRELGADITLSPKSYGPDSPEHENTTDENRRKNRRVLVVRVE